MYRRNSVILRERMVQHVREGIDQLEHLPTHVDYLDFINRYKSVLKVRTAEEVGFRMAEAGSFYVYPNDIYLFLCEVHDDRSILFREHALMPSYFNLIGQAFRDIENDRFPLEGDTP